MATSDNRKRVLMIEDDLTLCELVGSFLSKKGYDFVHHNSFDGAISCARDVNPDLIILDLYFPDGNGLHLCKLIKEDEELKKIPILVLTTRDYPVEKEMAMSSGATEFLQKPMDYELFSDKVDQILEDAVTVTFWGVRGSTPCPGSNYSYYGGNTMCMQVKIPGHNKLLIFDAGSGIRPLGNELVREGKPLTGHIFFTHAHWDHIQGFPFFNPLYSTTNRFDIHMPPQLAGSTKDVLLDQMSYTYFPVTSRMLKARLEYHTLHQSIQHFDGYSIQYITSNHPVETAIYKIQIGRKKIIFSPDNEIIASDKSVNANKNPYLKLFDNFVAGADLLIHDAQYDLEEYRGKKNWGHSAWELVVERAKRNKIRHLVLTHHDPDSKDDKLHRVAQKLKETVNGSGMIAELACEGNSCHL